MTGKASGRCSAGIADNPSSARITIGCGNVQARDGFPSPLSPRMVTIAWRSAGFLMVDNTLICIPHWVMVRVDLCRYTAYINTWPACSCRTLFLSIYVVNIKLIVYTCQHNINQGANKMMATEEIRHALGHRNLSYVAHEIGMSRQQLWAIVKGRNNNPPLRTLRRITHYLQA